MAKATATGPAKRVTCINKIDRHDPTERITHIGGGNTLGSAWKWTLDEAIAFIDRGGTLYVEEAGKQVEVFPAKASTGRRYLTTHPDDTTRNNLLSLPECP